MTEPKRRVPGQPDRCQAHSSRTGKPCKMKALPGMTVCRMHGGSAPQVRRKAAERLADLIDPDRALRTAALRAYVDIGDFYDEIGNLLPVKKMPENARLALQSIKTTLHNAVAGDGEQERVVEIRLHDATKNLEMLFKHLGLYEEKPLQGELTIKWEE